MNLSQIEEILSQEIYRISVHEEPAHDFLHFKRVPAMAKKLCIEENAKLEIILPAAWLHDFVIIPKNDSRRKIASQLSADAAIEFLKKINYPDIYFDEIKHAIAAHSFSANIATETLEAQIIQDADRLDGLGAIGLARCFATAGVMKRAFYSESDPFCENRLADDSQFTIDHFYTKLFKTVDTLKTATGRQEGHRRAGIMKRYLADLVQEIEA